MQTEHRRKPQIRARSPDRHNLGQRPVKRRRRWCDAVENAALANGNEEDAHRVAQRQKQIDYGKNTIAYDRFVAACPRESRKRGDPMTPLARQKCSKRSFAGQITSWKKKVYKYVAIMDEQTIMLDVDGIIPSSAITKVRGGPTGETGKSMVAKDFTVIASKANNVAEQKESHPETLKPDVAEEYQEEEEGFSDMDDIELDDFGNVVGDTPTPGQNEGEKAHMSGADESPASIFAPF